MTTRGADSDKESEEEDVAQMVEHGCCRVWIAGDVLLVRISVQKETAK